MITDYAAEIDSILIFGKSASTDILRLQKLFDSYKKQKNKLLKIIAN
jgi:hypothetical protein